ncbi:hypothetical protein AJ78_06760 [Emergomyces pasteurianus Ep9510]|uniref:Uncharacterized protein n=1 Tax=Emergomyces pasteurianus Ep9510 TaxID=1447872 RepID=A0A1J9P9R0_9EURO|nr:hypothetical protein AJ78_06760 [Emergomyces pasteurianus Ep9510]
MNLWEEIVQSDTIPKSDTLNKDKKLRYNAEHLTCSVLVQEYHVMIQAGLEYFYIINEFAIILLHVPYDDPSTLYYYLCEPNMDVISQNPETSSESEYASLKYMPSEHLPSSPLQPGHRVSTQSQTNCAPMDTLSLSDHMNSFNSNSDQAAHGRKRGINQVMSSPLSQRSSARSAGSRSSSGHSQHTTSYCIQRCLLSLQQRDELDYQCSNVSLYQRGQNDDQHCINARDLVQILNEQLDHDLDHNCTPFESCESYDALFKITCATYSYTLVEKRTTAGLWKVVSREAKIY